MQKKNLSNQNVAYIDVPLRQDIIIIIIQVTRLLNFFHNKFHHLQFTFYGEVQVESAKTNLIIAPLSA